MIGQQHLDRLMGATVIGEDGDKIGDIDTVYVDDTTGEPTFAQVNTGLFGLRSSFVPLDDAHLEDDEEQVRVPYTKDKVKDAPNLDPEGHLEPEQEQELYRFYDIEHDDAGAAPSGNGERATSGTEDTAERSRDDATTRSDDDAMTRSEEELHVETEQRPAGKARLRKHVVTDHVTKTVPVEREEVRLEREPVTADDVDEATSGPELTEDEHEVTLTEEEAVVEKRTVPKERVRLEKETVSDEEHVEEDVAREEIDLVGTEESRESQQRR